jgi:glycosyltransferase involved in cell wall biosynthesis
MNLLNQQGAYPLVSTVIPVYNRESMIVEALECALGQTYQNHEIVVVDNCSTDATLSVAKKFAEKSPRVKVYQNDTNIGPVRNWRRGVELARGEYCNILFSDDLLDPDFVSQLSLALREDVAFATGGFRLVKDGQAYAESVFQKQGTLSSEQFIKASILRSHGGLELVSPGCSMFRRSDLLSAIVVDIPNSHSIDFCIHGAGPDELIYLIVASRYKKVAFVDQVLASFRDHQGSITVAEGGKLMLPRDWARAFFLKNYKTPLASKFKAILWLRSFQDRRFREILNDLPNATDWRYAATLLMKHAPARLWKSLKSGRLLNS